jgi:hypothetical protein
VLASPHDPISRAGQQTLGEVRTTPAPVPVLVGGSAAEFADKGTKPFDLTDLPPRWRVVKLSLPERTRRTTFGLAGVVVAATLTVGATGTAVLAVGLVILAVSVGLAGSGVVGHSRLRVVATHARSRRG